MGVALVACLPAFAHADDYRPRPAPRPTGDPDRAEDARDEEEDAPDALTAADHTAFQAGAVLLALPAAQLCPVAGGACVPAETALGVSIDSLARVDDFGVGAGIRWAMGLRPSPVAGDPTLERKHRRMYFIVEGQFRYYLPHFLNWDWWVGASAGLVVLNDTWTTLADREPYSDVDLVGPEATTLRTEGLSATVGAGGVWNFYDRFMFGAQLRYGNWVLPGDRELAPLVGDQASLAGRIDVIDVGLVLGYLIPL